jgi:hypothetical protein
MHSIDSSEASRTQSHGVQGNKRAHTGCVARKKVLRAGHNARCLQISINGANLSKSAEPAPPEEQHNSKDTEAECVRTSSEAVFSAID